MNSCRLFAPLGGAVARNERPERGCARMTVSAAQRSGMLAPQVSDPVLDEMYGMLPVRNQSDELLQLNQRQLDSPNLNDESLVGPGRLVQLFGPQS